MAEAHRHPLVFDDFLSALRRQGFDIGVDQYLRLQELLAKVGGECSPQDLKTILCPIFAKSPAQQEQFHRAFDAQFGLFRTPAEEPHPRAPEAENPVVPPRTTQPARSRRRLYVASAAALAVIAVIAAVTLLITRRGDPQPAPQQRQPTQVEQPAPPDLTSEQQPPTQTVWPPASAAWPAGASVPGVTPTPTPQPTFYERVLAPGLRRLAASVLAASVYRLAGLWLQILSPLLVFLFFDQPPSGAIRRAVRSALQSVILLWAAAVLMNPLLLLGPKYGVDSWRRLWVGLYYGAGPWYLLLRITGWMAALVALGSFLRYYVRPPAAAAPKSEVFEHLRAPLLVLSALASLGLFFYKLPTDWTAVFAPVIFFLVYEWHRYRRRRLLLQKQRGRKPPFVWPIRLRAFAPRLFDSDLFYQAARQMRRRQGDENYSLDVEATVAATAESLGYPTFRYKFGTRPPEYLVLIDRASFRDHQAQLFNELTKALGREGIYVARYFYDADPRLCCEEAGGGCLSLPELHSKFAGHRLLVFGDGDRLLDPVTGAPAAWSAILSDWSGRALLTPTPPAQWGLRELSLARLCVVLPASLEGLLTLVTHFESLAETDVRGWRARGGEAAPPLAGDGADVVAGLRAYLGEPTFQWLCACSVYPELQWELTLYLGALPAMGGDLIREQNLLRLIRLPWFRAGSIPDETRWLLLRELEPEKERAVRRAIVELLERDPPPAETYAADAYQLNLVVQRWLSRRDRRRRREMLDALRSAPPQQLARDYTLLRLLEAAPPSALHVHLPARLRALFFHRGIPTLGVRTGARLALTLLLAAAGFGFHQLTRPFDSFGRAQAETSDGRGAAPAGGESQFAAGKLYKEMAGAEKVEFVKRRAQHVARMMGSRPYDIPPEVLRRIEFWIDAYASRAGNQRFDLWGGDIKYILERGRRHAPAIISAFNEERVPPVIGLYIPFIETEYINIEDEQPAGAAGMFQFIGPTAEVYGVSRAERTDVPKMARGAARYLRDRIAEYGDDPLSAVLAVHGYNREPDSIRREITNVCGATRGEGERCNYWALFSNRDQTDTQFQREGVEYVPRFFAAAIVGETPSAFGIQMRPLSTYTGEPSEADMTADLARALAAQITQDSSYNFDPSSAALIRSYVDEYLNAPGYYERAAGYRAAINREFPAQGVDPLVGYVVAMSQTKFVAQGDGGVWNLPPSVVASYGPDGKATNMNDPAISTRVAAAHFKMLIDTFGRQQFMFVMACYGMTPDEVGRFLSNVRKNVSNPFERESLSALRERGILQDEQVERVARFFAAGIACENPRRYGIDAKPFSSLADEPAAAAAQSPPAGAQTGSTLFSHTGSPHVELACAGCHQRAGDNAVQPAFDGKASLPGHKACTDCHLSQFVEVNRPLCSVCHTNVEGDASPPVKAFPPLRTFSTIFDHARHNEGAARPAGGCTTCHQRFGPRDLTTVRGYDAHAACFACHTPGARAGGRDISSCGVCHVSSRAGRN